MKGSDLKENDPLWIKGSSWEKGRGLWTPRGMETFHAPSAINTR